MDRWRLDPANVGYPGIRHVFAQQGGNMTAALDPMAVLAEADRQLELCQLRELRALIDSARPEDFHDLLGADDQMEALRTHPKSAAIQAVTVRNGRIVSIKLFPKRRRRPRPTSSAPIAAASIPPAIWPRSPAFFKLMAMPGSRHCLAPLDPVESRSRKWRAGRTAAGSSSMCGRRRSRRWPGRRSTGSARSMASRRRRGSRLLLNALPTALRPCRCWRHSSRGPTEPSP